MTRTDDLNSMFAKMFGGRNVIVTNHHMPLAGETFGGSTHDADVAAEATPGGGNLPANEVVFLEQFKEDFRWEAVLQAHRLALQAYGWLASDPGRAAQEAQAALKVSPICPEAYNVLALAQPILNLDKASELYRTGEECALQVLPPEGVDEELAGGDLWSRFCLRPWLRASLGVGNSLRKLGRYAEALEQCERLAQRLEWKMKSGPAVGSFVTL